MSGSIRYIGSEPPPIRSTTVQPKMGDAVPVSRVAKTYPPASALRSRAVASVGLTTRSVGLAPVPRIVPIWVRTLSIVDVPVFENDGVAATIWAKTCVSMAFEIWKAPSEFMKSLNAGMLCRIWFGIVGKTTANCCKSSVTADVVVSNVALAVTALSVLATVPVSVRADCFQSKTVVFSLDEIVRADRDRGVRLQVEAALEDLAAQRSGLDFGLPGGLRSHFGDLLLELALDLVVKLTHFGGLGRVIRQFLGGEVTGLFLSPGEDLLRSGAQLHALLAEVFQNGHSTPPIPRRPIHWVDCSRYL